MSTSEIEKAQMLWRARDEMMRAADEFRAAAQVMSAVADDMSWRSAAARSFQDSVAHLESVAEHGVVSSVDEADALLTQANQLVLR